MSSLRFAIFSRLEHLLTVCWEYPGRDTRRLPETIYHLPDEAWAVPLEHWTANPPTLFGHIQGSATRHRFSTKLEGKLPPGCTACPPREVLNYCWVYRDPVLTTNSAVDLVAGAPQFNPRGRGLRYLLAAKSESEAQQILDALTASLVRGVKAKPIQFEGGQCPFSFFWLVMRGAQTESQWGDEDAPVLPLSVAAAAQHVWWSDGSHRLFFPWPYVLNLPLPLLREIYPGSPESWCLLSRDTPACVEIRQPADAPEFSDLIDVIRLEQPRPEPVAQGTGVQPRPGQFQFQVELRLTEKPQPYLVADHIQRLDREIAAKRAIRDQMEMALETSIPDEPDFFQPLFIYFSSDPAHAPYAIGRLLVEWSDQPNQLRGLRHLRLPIEQFPANLRRPEARAAHVVTTAAALGEPGSVDLGLRLREYASNGDGIHKYELLSDWAAKGLHVFVPLEEHLELFPPFPINEDTAGKLAQALLGNDLAEPSGLGQWCFLLDRRSDRKIQTVLLPRQGFAPLVEAAQWKSHAEIERHQINVPAETVAVARELLAIAQQDLQNAVGKLGVEWLARESSALKALVDSRVAELDSRRQRNQAALDQVAQAHEAAIRGLTHATREMDLLNQAVSALAREHGARGQSHEATQALTRLTNLRQHIESLRTEVGGLREKYAAAEVALRNQGREI